MTQAVALRLTPKQMSVIWTGLDFLVSAESKRKKDGTAKYYYLFRVYPPPAGFDRGTMHPQMMNIVIALWKKLRAKRESGGRLQLDCLEIRAAVFAVRVAMAIMRTRQAVIRRKEIEYRAAVKAGIGSPHAAPAFRGGISPERLNALREEAHAARVKEAQRYTKRSQMQARRTITSLERHMKRANRQLLRLISKDEYTALMSAWQQHLRWMRLHLAYFGSQHPPTGSKRKRQELLDILTDIAVDGLKKEGYVPPEPRELRRALRLYVRSSTRGREGVNSIPFLLRHPKHVDTKRFLAEWVVSRTQVGRAR